jgi:molybdopterin synthase sulfur carrier subunit
MGVKLLFFAQCADWLAMREAEIALEKPMRVDQLLRSRPELAPLLDHAAIVKVAVNRTIADFDAEVHNGDEVAFLPPVSGG